MSPPNRYHSRGTRAQTQSSACKSPGALSSHWDTSHKGPQRSCPQDSIIFLIAVQGESTAGQGSYKELMKNAVKRQVSSSAKVFEISAGFSSHAQEPGNQSSLPRGKCVLLLSQTHSRGLDEKWSSQDRNQHPSRMLASQAAALFIVPQCWHPMLKLSMTSYKDALYAWIF